MFSPKIGELENHSLVAGLCGTLLAKLKAEKLFAVKELLIQQINF